MKTLILIAALGLALPLGAATGGPDSFGYTWTDSEEAGGPVYQFIEPTFEATTILQNNTAIAGTIDLAVPWGGLYGAQVTQLRVSRNGYLSTLLTDNGNDETNDPVPTTPSVGGGNRFYVVHDNLELDTTLGLVTYEYFPRSPHAFHDCGVHVITWKNVHHQTGDTTRFDFQALLFDNFDLIYQFAPGNPELGLGSTTGIQNAAATTGLGIVVNDKALPDNHAILIRPPRLVVNTTVDELNVPAGTNLSLREAIRDATNGSRIEFNIPNAGSVAPLIDLSATGGGQGSRITLNARNLAIDGSAPASRPALYGGREVRHLDLQSGTHLAVNDLRFTHGNTNSTVDPSGSVRVQGGSSLVACGSEFSENRTANEGGAVYVDDAGSAAYFGRCEFMTNSALGAGGAIAVRDDATLGLDHCRLWLNASTSGAGGALAIRATVARIVHCEFARNRADDNGGAIVANVSVDCDLFACTFDANEATSGGAIAAENLSTAGATPASMTFSRCTFSENLALLHGGALYENSRNASLQTAQLGFLHSTLFRNGAGVSGGAISVTHGIPTFQGVCVANNTISGKPGNFTALGTGATLSFGENLESESDVGFTNGGLDTQNADPLLAPLGYYGGFVRTCIPRRGSPLIDTAYVGSAASAFDARGIATAQDGDGTVASPPFDYDDIGAVELAPPTLLTAATQASLQAAILAAPRGGTIRFDDTDLIEFSGFLTLPAGSMLFIESPVALALKNIRFQANAAEIAFDNIEFDGNSQGDSRLIMGGTGASLNLSRCRLVRFGSSGQPTLRMDAGGRLSLAGCEVRGNRSRGIVATTQGFGVIRDCHFTDNTPVGPFVTDHRVLDLGGPMLLDRNSFTDNLVDPGAVGGGSPITIGTFSRDQPTILEFRNSTISGNRSRSAVVNASINLFLIGSDYVPSTVRFDHLTVANNQLESNFATRLLNSFTNHPGSTVSFANSIFSGNGTSQIHSGMASAGGNLADVFIPASQPSDVSSTDALLGPLTMGRNGTRHHALQPASPAIDAALGSPAGTIDGRGTIRYVDGDSNASVLPDIGAVESGRVITVTTTVDENNGGLGLGTGNSLRECLEESTNGPVNIAVSPAISSITLGGVIPILDHPHAADFNLDGPPLTLSTSAAVFVIVNGSSLMAMDHCHLNGTGANLSVGDQAAVTLSRSSVKNLVESRVCQINNAARFWVSSSVIADNIFPASSTAAGFYIIGDSQVEVSDSAVVRNSSASAIGSVFRVSGRPRLTLTRTTVSENAVPRLVNAFLGTDFVNLDIDRSTLHRNGGGINSGKGILNLTDSILSRNHGTAAVGFPQRNYGHGGNLTDLVFAHAAGPDDLEHHLARLAPLADYDGDGLPENPPLAASPVFGTETGATAPPEILVVTTTANQNDTPAGPQLSLKEAVRDIAPGGTILFDPRLNNGTFTTETLFVAKSMTIDATALPSGIDLAGRFRVTDAAVRLAVHGLHIRDNVADGGIGGAFSMDPGNLVASHCTVSGNNGYDKGGAIYIAGDMTLENCTFAQSNSSVSSGIDFLSGAHLIRYCTFAGNAGSPPAAVLQISPTAGVALFGNLFFGNAHPTATGTPLFSQFNIYGDTPAFATGSDITGAGAANFTAFADHGGYVPTYSYQPVTGLEDHVTDVGAGKAQPPETDARGFSRIAYAAPDAGAHEFAGEVLYGTGFGDNDTLPAWWELQYGLDPFSDDDLNADVDGDGLTLYEEFCWLTDPFDAAQSFSFSPSFDLTVQEATFEWSAMPGYEYRIESSTTLTGSWTEESVVTGDTSNALDVFTFPLDPATDPKKFYRLRRIAP